MVDLTDQIGGGLPPQSHHGFFSLLLTGKLRQGERHRHQIKLHLQGGTAASGSNVH